MNKYFWIALVKRAAHTAAQTALSFLTIGMVMEDVDWKMVISAACLAAIYSSLKSLAVGVPEVEGSGE
jgi:hypothetical protein